QTGFPRLVVTREKDRASIVDQAAHRAKLCFIEPSWIGAQADTIDVTTGITGEHYHNRITYFAYFTLIAGEFDDFIHIVDLQNALNDLGRNAIRNCEMRTEAHLVVRRLLQRQASG